MDYNDNEQESDVRHEPLPVKHIDHLAAPSVKIESHLNGHSATDVVMSDGHTPGISADFSMASIDGASVTTRPYQDDSDDHPEPPTKRARMYSDADMASMTHVSFFFPLLHRRAPSRAC
jgi:bromodomain-containing factor 1